MILAEWGGSGLWASLLISVIKIVLLGWSKRSDLSWVLWRGQQVAVFSEFICLTISFGCLIAAYILSDFSLQNVVDNSHSALSLFYRVCGTWSNHEGSMMLWLWILSLYGVLMAWQSHQYLSNHSLSNQSMIVQIAAMAYHGILIILIGGYILKTSNPFLLTDAWIQQGHELNPLLQDPALAIHPPILYLGYVGFAVPFCYALAGWSCGSVQNNFIWLYWIRRWSLWAWGFLTLGIALGSFWAYYELGWGGYWFWDPVETASLLPWLTGAALVHISQINHHTGMLLKTSWLLAVSGFIMALLGTYLVRSGVLSTVHAFAQSADRGYYLLLMIGLVIGLASVVCIKNYRQFAGQQVELTLNKSSLILVSVYIIFVLVIVVGLGTLYPLILESLGGDAVSIGTPYFTRTFVPISLGLVILMGIAGFTTSSTMTFQTLMHRLHGGILILLLAIVIPLVINVDQLLSVYALELSLWMIGMVLVSCWRKREHWWSKLSSGMTLAHMGCALMIVGMAVDHLGRQETVVALKIGEQTTFAGYDLRLDHINYQREATYMSEVATIHVSRVPDKMQTGFIFPEKRFYPSYQALIAKTALQPQNFSYLYVVLGGLLSDQRWTLRLYYHPQVMWIWLGAALMAIGMFRSWVNHKSVKLPQ